MFLQTSIVRSRFLTEKVYTFSKFSMSSSAKSEKTILALPSTAEENVKVDINENFKLTELGPVVINENGTMSRINNWQEMNDIERENVNRILLKRNKKRLEVLKAAIEKEEESQ